MIIIDNEFIQEHKGLIHQLIFQGGRKYDKEEVESLFVDTVIKLLQNARYFDGKYSIGTFIGLQVRSAISEFTAKEVGNEDALNLAVTDEIPEESDEQDTTDLDYFKDAIAPYLMHLSEIERDVFTDRVFEGLTIADVGERRDLHTKSVSRILNRASSRLRSFLKRGKRVSPMHEVEIGVPLGHAIKTLLDNLHYFAFKLHHFDGKSLAEISRMNGQSPARNKSIIESARHSIRQEYGYGVC